jgi:hypothetical protein
MKTLIAALILITAAWGQQNAPLGQQKMCMEQVNKLVEARQEFRAQMNASPNIITFSYTDTNHFNPRDRICYWTTRTQVQTPDRLRLLGISITDAFPGDTAAEFEPAADGKKAFCFVEALRCHSEKEFLTLAFRMQYRK